MLTLTLTLSFLFLLSRPIFCDNLVLKVNEKMGEVMEIMKQNVERVLERGEKIDLLSGKALTLSYNSS